MNSWIYLVIAGICEVLWAVPLKFSEGFTKLIPSVLTVIFLVLSM
ncbi:MAG TPA: QacE family quaternary ammonium compound efflux SMR transporter, partial [Methanosphaera sp.]|nr:QacE family quaternary ammonium compound efflux SMR transporter [Methanosphaera sp.]